MPPGEKSVPAPEQEELIHRIALTLAPAIGPIMARKLISKLGSPGAVLLQDRAALEKIPGIGPRLSRSIRAPALLKQAEKEVEFLERHRIKALYYRDPGYPKRLNQCVDGPILLYSRGEQGLECRRSLSVVGTRRATSYGRDICRKIIRDLADQVEDLVIVSGLAYGIDVIAHRAALEYGIPTIAVLGHGMSTIYPASHREVARKIAARGTLVSDFPSGMGPEKNNFIRRNRIIAGISDATLVVESGHSGGALITADLASSYDRTVMAVPGRSGDVWSAGCNALIKDNVAAMVETGEDIMGHLNWDLDNEPGKVPVRNVILSSAEERLILRHLRECPGSDPGSMSRATGIPLHTLLALLLQMELKRFVRMDPGNRYHAGQAAPGDEPGDPRR